MKQVLLLESVSDEAHQLLEEHTKLLVATSPDAGGELAAGHDIHAIITRGKGDVSEQLISQCPKLEVIARCGVGLDNINVAFATQQGVKVINAPGSNADTVAEHALSLMLCLQRDLYNSITQVKRSQWEHRNRYSGDEIRDKTLGILGMGNIGKKVAKLATAFGMQIIYWDAYPQTLPYEALPLDEVLQRADILTLHLPLTPDTNALINAAALQKMQSHTLLINTARGSIIDQQDLIDALENGTIGGFAADVLDTEPPLGNNPLLRMSNVLITHHSASLTARTYNEMCVITVRNALSVLDGDSIDHRYIFNHAEL